MLKTVPLCALGPFQAGFFLFLLFVASCAQAELLASSKVASCVLDGSLEETTLNCKKKLVLTISIDNGQVTATT